jgi:Concanavalin A-like lectin/glucanases superfamily
VSARSLMGTAVLVGVLVAGCDVRRLQTVVEPPDASVEPDADASSVDIAEDAAPDVASDAASDTSGDVAGDALSASLAKGQVAHWSCNESGGHILHDTSGNGRHGYMTGGTFTSGWFGNGLTLQRGQYVTVPDFPDATPSWSISMWSFIPYGDPQYGPSSLITTESASGGGFAMRMNDLPSDSMFHFRYAITADSSVDTYESYACPCLVAFRWIHLVAIVDGDSMTLTFYSDGSFRIKKAITQTIRPGLPELLMGRTIDERYYSGGLDDVTIWSRALTEDEILRLYRQAAPDVVPLSSLLPPPTLDAGIADVADASE